jgi:hypothetical protein
MCSKEESPGLLELQGKCGLYDEPEIPLPEIQKLPNEHQEKENFSYLERIYELGSLIKEKASDGGMKLLEIFDRIYPQSWRSVFPESLFRNPYYSSYIEHLMDWIGNLFSGEKSTKPKPNSF